jgi:hypothetical protein
MSCMCVEMRECMDECWVRWDAMGCDGLQCSSRMFPDKEGFGELRSPNAESSTIGRNAKVNQVIHVVVVAHPQVIIIIMCLHRGCIRLGLDLGLVLHCLWLLCD